jgi:hypothetical protein
VYLKKLKIKYKCYLLTKEEKEEGEAGGREEQERERRS